MAKHDGVILRAGLLLVTYVAYNHAAISIRMMAWLHGQKLVYLKGAFETLNWLFYRVGIRKNAEKTVRMICRLCRA